MTTEEEPRSTSILRTFSILRWVFLALAAGGVVLIALSFGESGAAALTAGIGTVVLSLACFVAMTMQIRKGRGSTETPSPGGST